MPSSVSSWQSRLLPYMIAMLFGVTIFFLVATVLQLYGLQSRISSSAGVNIENEIKQLQSARRLQGGQPDNVTAVISILARFEAASLENRYAMAKSVLMARLWARYLGFVTGMIIALVGSIFILGKLREGSSTVNIDSSVAKVALASTSPGLIMVGLGTLLMLVTILTNPDLSVKDGRIYMSDISIPASSEVGGPPVTAKTNTSKGDQIIRGLATEGEQNK